MERTTLEVICGPLFGDANFQLETIQSAKVHLGAGEGSTNSEGPESRFCINVDTKAYDPATGTFSRDIHVQLWITPSQIADIVKQYFAEMLRHVPNVYGKLLERILRKRWTVMTSSVYRLDHSPGTPRSLEPYYRIRTW
jgi:hypothetical protein